MTKYRTDIDGLRAVAVAGVVIFHAFPTALTGGFVGVDVFFVLSGFLITAIIRTEAEAGTFSIAGFYERRFRRIVPALVAMLLATTVAATIILPPSELAAYGKSVVGVAAFVSNILFWRDSGYFDAASVDKPLLHTWSLAVEEQFYIFWPLVTAALIRRGGPRALGAFVSATVIVSLVLAVMMVRLAPSQAFYLLPYRAWELGFGALLAVGAVPTIRRPALREAAAWAGLILIVTPMLIYTEATPFPGLAAVPPCLGTLLLIHAGQGYQTRVGRMLSVRPILNVGLTSYSLYLWHWPLLVLPRIALNRPLAPAEAALAIVATFVLAALSLRFVERPFRGRGTLPLSRRQVMAASAGAAAVAGAVGIVTWGSHGFAALSSPEVRAAEAVTASINPRRAACHNDGDTGTLGPVAHCIGGQSSPGGYQVLLWGDSHADHLMPGLSTLGRQQGFRVRQASVSGCSPLVLTAATRGRSACAAFHRAALAEAGQQARLRAIVISLRWATAMPGIVQRVQPFNTGMQRFRQRLEELIARTRRAVGPAPQIVLVGSTPEFAFWPATCFARAAKLDTDNAICNTAAPTDARWSTAADRELRALAVTGVTVVLPRARLCSSATRCITAQDGEVLFRDDDHLTNAGAVLVARQIGPAILPSGG